MLGREDLVVLSQLIRVMEDKGKNPFRKYGGGVNERITIAVARSYSWMIRGDPLPSTLREQEPGWDPELGIGLAG